MHVDPIQTCFGFVIDPSRVLIAIYLLVVVLVISMCNRMVTSEIRE